MTIDEFVRHHDLKAADVIVASRNGFAVMDHYVVYLGIVNGRHQFAANLINHGVINVSDTLLRRLLPNYSPDRIRRFVGSESERLSAVCRAWNHVDNNTRYNLATYNCEHFANEIQFNRSYSRQTQIGTVAALLLVGALIARK